MDELRVLIKESEKKTLWKVDECEKIIVQKVNKEYVDSSLVLIESKMQKMVSIF